MSEILDSGLEQGNMTITAQMKSYLLETAKWAKFLSIVGFVFLGIMILIGLFFGAIMGSAFSGLEQMEGVDTYPGGLGAMGSFMGIFYIIIAAIYFFPLLYLYRFATKTKLAVNSDDQENMRSALENLKSHYKFMGILMAVILVFYAIVIVFGLIGGALIGLGG